MDKDEFKQLQKQMGLTNTEMAAELGRSLSSVCKYRCGEIKIPSTVAKLMRLIAKPSLRGEDNTNNTIKENS